jgi:hypothetical protein
VFTRINKIADVLPKTGNFYLLGDPGSSVWLALVVVGRQGEGITEKRTATKLVAAVSQRGRGLDSSSAAFCCDCGGVVNCWTRRSRRRPGRRVFLVAVIELINRAQCGHGRPGGLTSAVTWMRCPHSAVGKPGLAAGMLSVTKWSKPSRTDVKHNVRNVDPECCTAYSGWLLRGSPTVL